MDRNKSIRIYVYSCISYILLIIWDKINSEVTDYNKINIEIIVECC